MTSDKYYNPAIQACLQTYVGTCDWQGILSYLDTLSHAQFRTAGHIIGTQLMGTMPEAQLWALAETLVRYHAKAFLGTVLKALGEAFEKGRIRLRSTGAKAFWLCVKQNPVDKQKTLLRLLPVLERPEDVVWLLRRMDVEEGEESLFYLIRMATMPTRFVLLHTLRFVEHNRELVVRVARFLIKQGDGASFNLASLLCTLYGLKEVGSTFSLRLEAYQLARVESSYEAFCEVMRR